MVNIAIVGMGVMGKNHYRILQTLPEANIVALCDPHVQEEFAHPLYRDLETMLNSLHIDAIIIAVPTFLHKDVALLCLEKGVKNLLIEKPLAPSIEEGYTILHKAKECEAKVMVGHVERFNPVVQALKQELENKEIYSINITRVGPFPPRIADVGVLTDLAVHDIDLIRFIAQREIEKKSIFKSQKIHDHYEDNAILTFKLEEDIIASITTNWLTPYRKRKIEVACKEGYYEADLTSQELIEYSNYKTNNSFVTRVCFVKKGEPLLNELTSFLRYIQTGQNPIGATIEDSLQTLKIIEG